MPSFADSLTPEQIAAVVEYTRTDLGTDRREQPGISASPGEIG